MLFQVENLACRRGLRLVFRDIGFALDNGGFLLVTGPNGSGKSSLLRILAGLLSPANGAMQWGGEKVDRISHRVRLHYIGHHDAVKPELTVAEMLGYWNALRARPAHRVTVPEAFGLDTVQDLPVRYLSAGQRRRLALARLAMDDAPLWLLDEPATSLDRAGQELLTSLIAAHRAKGGIAVIAGHHVMDMPDVQGLWLPGGRA